MVQGVAGAKLLVLLKDSDRPGGLSHHTHTWSRDNEGLSSGYILHIHQIL